MPKVVEVTRAQRAAAKLRMERDKVTGRGIDPRVQAIADAQPARTQPRMASVSPALSRSPDPTLGVTKDSEMISAEEDAPRRAT